MRVITLLRKPVEGSITQNVLKHGSGSLSIDACRIGYVSQEDRREETRGVHVGGPYEHVAGKSFKKAVNRVAEAHDGGRWPPNVVLQHLAGCRVEGTRKIQGHKGYPNGPGGKSDPRHGWGAKRSAEVRPNAWASSVTDADETVRVCDPGCPVADLDQQSGPLGGGIRRINQEETNHENSAIHEGYRRKNRSSFVIKIPGQVRTFGDKGGASRFFKQVKS